MTACVPLKGGAPIPAPVTAPVRSSSFCAPTPPASAAGFQAAFDGLRAAGTGWVAADGAIHVDLPDGRRLWMFGDTIVGDQRPDRSVLPGWSLPSNTFVVESDGCFTPGLVEAIPDPAPGQFVWPTGAVLEGAALRVFGYHMRQTADPAPFNFAVVRMVVATFSLPDLTYQELHALPAWGPDYGSTVTVAGGQVYAYGRIHDQSSAQHYVARHVGDVTSGVWEFWGEAGWTPDHAAAAPLVFDGIAPTAGFHVAESAGGFFGSAMHADVLGHTIGAWSAPAPEGPWTSQGVTATIDPVPDQFAYGGRVIHTLPGAPVVVWSTTSWSFGAVLADPAIYAAVFR